MMFAIATLLLAQAVTASPLAYLKCDIQQKRGVVTWDITLNEAAGILDYDNAISGPQRRPARFTGDKVYFVGFELSRVDGTIRRTNLDYDGNVESIDSGTCRLANPKAREF